MKIAAKGYYDEFLASVVLPPMAHVSVTYDGACVEDIAGTVRREIEALPCVGLVRGKTVALAVGSRGIRNLPLLVKTTIDTLRAHGAKVFIVPAMGSHGGANAEGQRRLLEHLGVSAQTMGVEVRASMETVEIACTGDNVPVYFDKNAASADYTVSIARVKPHTTFNGPYESGMMKMNVIGLGKQLGADYCHFQGMMNMGQNIEKIGRVSLACSNLLFSLAVVENAYDQTCLIRAVDKKDIADVEPELLLLAKSLMPCIPFRDLDMLVVDEIGKDITGTGMDPNIIQRFSSEHMVPEPFIKRLVILDMTDATDGNAAGAGFADIATMRVYDKMEMEKTYPNSLTARTTIPSKMPIFMENDHNAMRAGIKTAYNVKYDAMRIVRIRNTLCTTRLDISPALLPEAERLANVHVESGPAPYVFDAEGNLEKAGFLYQ